MSNPTLAPFATHSTNLDSLDFLAGDALGLDAALPLWSRRTTALDVSPIAVVVQPDRPTLIADSGVDLVSPKTQAIAAEPRTQPTRSAQRSLSYDPLLGLRSDQPIAQGQPRAAATLNSRSYSSIFGYGQVDARAAVAASLGFAGYDKLLMPDVADSGGNQWNTDQINAAEVWARGIKGQGVTVAVIDEGVDIDHPDLQGNIWQNRAEIANDGIDNDSNGYVDDIYGWNFATDQYNNNVRPRDRASSHGTHVAGTIAAQDNGLGMTGVAPRAKIMALKIGETNLQGQFTSRGSLAEAVYYAVNNGADVINISLKWEDSTELGQALAYAAANDVIVVSSAGNDNALTVGQAPAYYATNYGITVGAVDRTGNRYAYSNQAGFNSSLNYVVAPGVDIYSTIVNDRDGVIDTDDYAYLDGTSMASPHVAGVVALMLSANPFLTHDEVRTIVTATATQPSPGATGLGGIG